MFSVHRHSGMLGKRGGRLDDCLYRYFIANAGIDHQVEAMPFRPFHFEILLDESRPIIVHRFHETDRFLLALAVRLKATDLVLKGSVDKNVKRVATVRKVVGGASADDYAVTGFRDLQQDFMGYFSDAVGIHRVEPGRVHTSFEAA